MLDRGNLPWEGHILRLIQHDLESHLNSRNLGQKDKGRGTLLLQLENCPGTYHIAICNGCIGNLPNRKGDLRPKNTTEGVLFDN